VISKECAEAADLLAIKRDHAQRLLANGHKEIARGVLTASLRDAVAQHATCGGCDCQCEIPEVTGRGGGLVQVAGVQSTTA
jgi:hypothetical protein